MSLLLLLRPSKDGTGMGTDGWWMPYMSNWGRKKKPQTEHEAIEEIEDIAEEVQPTQETIEFAETSRKIEALLEARAALVRDEREAERHREQLEALVERERAKLEAAAERERIRVELAAAEQRRVELAIQILMQREEEEAAILYLLLD